MSQSPILPIVFGFADVLGDGLARYGVDWRVRSGAWRRLRRGRFCRGDVWEAATATQRHLLNGIAAALAYPDHVALSHLTAAAFWGWPMPLDIPTEVSLTRASSPDAFPRRRHGVRLEVASIAPDEVIRVGGLRVLSPARTVADCLRRLAPQVSVPVGDAALAAGLCPQLLAAALDAQRGWPFAARVPDLAALLDGRRETWLESVSAVAFHDLDLPQPTPQVLVFDARGKQIGRVDFWWEEQGAVGEADGMGKYEVAAPGSPPDPMARLRTEKTREDRLRGTGLEVVRWGTTDAVHPYLGLRARVLETFRRGDRTRFSGVALPMPPPAVRDRPDPAGLQSLLDLATALGTPALRP